MAKSKKVGKNRQDKFYKLAKEQGFRARSAFKLIQLNRKYNFLNKSRVLIDLCAAPGGWLQVAEKYMPVSSVIVGVDLVPIKPIRNVITMVNDITTEKCRQDLKKELKTWKADVVLHDGSPNMGQNWLQDAYTQADLTLKALKLATEFLVEGGLFVTKVFRSKDYNALLWIFNQLFKIIEVTKPSSSRNESAEIYVICKGFLAPKRIDPKLLDPRHVFMEVEEGQKVPNIFISDQKLKKKHKPLAEGYEDGKQVLYKTYAASKFISDHETISILAFYHELTFQDDESKEIAKLDVTTKEILECCKDLRVLGRKEFRNLMKWRTMVRKILKKDEKEKEEEEKESSEEEEEEEDEDEKIGKEISSIQKAEKAKKKREKKKLARKKAKINERLRLNMIHPDDQIDVAEDLSLFSLKSLRGSGNLNDIVNEKLHKIDNVFGENGLVEDSSSEEDSDEEVEEESGSEIEVDLGDVDLKADYYQDLEETLDSMYEQFLYQRDGKKALRVNKRKLQAQAKEAGDRKEYDGEDVPLEVNFDEPQMSKKAKIWFDQDIFQNVEDDSDDEDIKKMNSEAQKRNVRAVPNLKNEKSETNEEDSDSDWDSDSSSESEPEIVPEMEDSDDEENPRKLPGRQLTAEQIAMAELVRDKKKREQAIDNAFNRYTFNDEQLPDWFQADESKHNKPMLPVTKEAVQLFKEKLKEINDRPIKKVMEARARKKYKLQKKLEKIKQKANSIADSEDINEKQKLKQIQSLYKVKLKKKVDVKYVVAKKGGGGKPSGVKGKYKMVDSRLRKDTRAAKRIAKKLKPKRSKK